MTKSLALVALALVAGSHAWGRSQSSSSGQQSDMQACVQTCLRPFKAAVSSRDDQRICGAFEPFKSCVLDCPMGEKVWQLSQGKDPEAFRNLARSCSGRAGSRSGSRAGSGGGRGGGSWSGGGSRSGSSSSNGGWGNGGSSGGSSRGWGSSDTSRGWSK